MDGCRFIELGFNGTLVEKTGHVNREQSYAELLNRLCYNGRDSEIKYFDFRKVFESGVSPCSSIRSKCSVTAIDQLFDGLSPVILNIFGAREFHRQWSIQTIKICIRKVTL